jgi:hypothetical protein
MDEEGLDYDGRSMGDDPQDVGAIDALTFLLGLEGGSIVLGVIVSRFYTHQHFQTRSRGCLCARFGISDSRKRNCSTSATPSVSGVQDYAPTPLIHVTLPFRWSELAPRFPIEEVGDPLVQVRANCERRWSAQVG